MRILACLGIVALLAACGADGPPTRPEADLGLTVSNDGVGVSAGVGLRHGPVSLRIGL